MKESTLRLVLSLQESLQELVNYSSVGSGSGGRPDLVLGTMCGALRLEIQTTLTKTMPRVLTIQNCSILKPTLLLGTATVHKWYKVAISHHAKPQTTPKVE